MSEKSQSQYVQYAHDYKGHLDPIPWSPHMEPHVESSLTSSRAENIAYQNQFFSPFARFS